jgi:hypothetical protein
MRRLSTGLTILAAACLALGACQSASPSASVLVVGSVPSGGIIPIVVNPEFGVGPNHLVMTVVDAGNVPIASPDRAASIALTSPAGATDAAGAVERPMDFQWGITGSVGFYILDVNLPVAGTWQGKLTLAGPGSATASATVSFDVKTKTSAVGLGEPAPSVKTPTATDVGGDLKKISTDPKPDPRFYAISEDAALAAHKPFVLVFATPAFCQTAMCGPALDHVKALVALYPDVAFIHVEPYEMTFTNGRLQPTGGNLAPNAITTAWGLLSEPWVYVVDRTGKVKASFPSVFTDVEFKAALDAVR